VSKLSPLSKNKIILDTGPLIYLLLYNCNAVGEIDVSKRIDNVSGLEFSIEKSKLLIQKLSGRNLFVTSHTLAEVSNHVESNNYNLPLEKFLEINSRFIAEDLEEDHSKIGNLLESTLGLQFGVTDCSIHEVMESGDYALVSTDEDILEGVGLEGHTAVPLESLLMDI
jgi:predicted nucleic acid-binding protein